MDEHIGRAVAKGRTSDDAVAVIADELTVGLGAELAAIVPGRISTEVEARLSFDAEKSIAKAHAIIDAYDKLGIGRERILIKLASTWEGIRAAEVLQREGIDCNLTLLFSMAQAMACADAGVTLDQGERQASIHGSVPAVDQSRPFRVPADQSWLNRDVGA